MDSLLLEKLVLPEQTASHLPEKQVLLELTGSLLPEKLGQLVLKAKA
jgi:hypothetical protein